MAKKKDTPAPAATGAGTTDTTTTTAAAAAPAKAAKVEQNGVTRPSSGATLKVWEIADRLSAAKKAPAERKEVTEAGIAEGLVVGTIHTQYGRWRKFHGLAKVVEKSAAPAADASAAAT